VAASAGFQPTLFDSSPPSVDLSAVVERIHLDGESWVDLVSGWLRGSDRVFEDVLRSMRWEQRTRWMYDRRVPEPRLTSSWVLASGLALQPGVIEEARLWLCERYDVVFDSAGFNLYRDGNDSVAWHGDRIPKAIRQPIVALLSLGERRRFLLRPRRGGRSLAFDLGRGDLLVTGGETQRTWQHAVPKVRRAGPRISVAFRHGVDARAYDRGRSRRRAGDA
jgi:alkylated DNA repair dioxygenase AlkB